MQRDRGEQRNRRSAHPGAEVAHGRGGDVTSGERRTEQRGRADERGEGDDRGERLTRSVHRDEHRGERPRGHQHDRERATRTERHPVSHERGDDHEYHRHHCERNRSRGARRPRRTLGSIVSDAGEIQRLDVVEPGGHGHSDRRTTAGRVRAARRAGTAAMRLTAMSAAGMSTLMPSTGQVASVDTPRFSATCVPHEAADRKPERDADEQTDGGDRRRVPADGHPHLPALEAKRLEDGEVATPTAHGGHEREPDGHERDDHDERRPSATGRPSIRATRSISAGTTGDSGRPSDPPSTRSRFIASGAIDSWRESHDEVPAAIAFTEACEPSGREYREVGEGRRIGQARHDRLTDDAVPQPAFRSTDADAVAHGAVPSPPTCRHPAPPHDRARRPAFDDRRVDAAAELLEPPGVHRGARDLDGAAAQ